MNGPDVLEEGCTHFLQLLVWERKENPEVGTEVERMNTSESDPSW